MNDFAMAGVARKAAVSAEILVLKARRCLAEQNEANVDDLMLALRGMTETLTSIYRDIQTEERGHD